MVAVVGTSCDGLVIFGGGEVGTSGEAGGWFAALLAAADGFGTSEMRRPVRGRGFGLLAIVVVGSDGALTTGSSSPGGRTSGGGMMALSGSIGAGTNG